MVASTNPLASRKFSVALITVPTIVIRKKGTVVSNKKKTQSTRMV